MQFQFYTDELDEPWTHIKEYMNEVYNFVLELFWMFLMGQYNASNLNLAGDEQRPPKEVVETAIS